MTCHYNGIGDDLNKEPFAIILEYIANNNISTDIYLFKSMQHDFYPRNSKVHT